MSNLLAELRAQFESELLRSRYELHSCNPDKSTPDIEPEGGMNGQGWQKVDLWQIYRLKNSVREIVAGDFSPRLNNGSMKDK